MKHTVEYWGIDKNGRKHHDTIKVSSTRSSKIKKEIEKKLKTDLTDWSDFGMRNTSDI